MAKGLTNADVTFTVTRTEPVIVQPSTTAGSKEFFYLSNLDQNVAVVMKTVNLFEATPSRSSNNVAQVLKEALAKVLVHYYPCTGTLTINDEGKLIVRCDGRGVPFVEAVADCEMKALGDISVPDHSKLAELIYVCPHAKNLLETPLLTVQVTRFKCGGFVVGMAMNHCLLDGRSCVEFMNAWAETARGLPLSVPPFIDRTIQHARRPPKIEFPHHEFTEIEDISDLASMYETEPIVYRSFTFNADKMYRLKKLAMQDQSDRIKCSGFVALTAFVWQARSKALRLHPDQKTKLLFAVDGRNRFEPPLPRGFWGNGIVFAVCLCAARELIDQPLSFAVQSIQDAINGVTDAFIRSAIDYFELTRARPSLTGTLLVTTWTRLGFKSPDFGWGEAVQSGPAELPQKEVVVLLPGTKDSKSTVVVMGLPSSAMESFEDIVDAI